MDLDGSSKRELEEVIRAVLPDRTLFDVGKAWGGYDTAWGRRTVHTDAFSTRGTTVFVKRYGDLAPSEDLLSSHVTIQGLVAEQLFRFSEKRGFLVRAPLLYPRLNVPFSDRYRLIVTASGGRFSVFEYSPLRFCSWGETEGSNLAATARGIARLHAGLAAMEGLSEIPCFGAALVNSYPIGRIRAALDGQISPDLDSLRSRILDVASEFERRFQKVDYDALPIWTIHGDLAPIHLAFESRDAAPELARVIDWERCMRSTRLWDFTRLLFRQTRSIPGGMVLLPDESARFLAAYEAEALTLGIPLTGAERRAYPYILLLFHFRVIEEFLVGGGTRASEWTTRNVESLECLLDTSRAMERTGPHSDANGWCETSDERVALQLTTRPTVSVDMTFEPDADGSFGAVYLPRSLFDRIGRVERVVFDRIESAGIGSAWSFALEVRFRHAPRDVRTLDFSQGEQRFVFVLPDEIGDWDEIGIVFSASLNGLRRFRTTISLE